MKLNANNELEYKILHVIYEGGNIINLFDINLAKIFSIISVFFAILLGISDIVFRNVVAKNENKRIEEIESKLVRILNFRTLCAVLFAFFGIIGILLRK